MQPSLCPAAPAVWHSTDKLNAELVQRAVATIVHRLAVRAGVPRRGWSELLVGRAGLHAAEIAWRRMKRGLPEQLVARSHEGKSLTWWAGRSQTPIHFPDARSRSHARGAGQPLAMSGPYGAPGREGDQSSLSHRQAMGGRPSKRAGPLSRAA